jgi:hypothetical protein
MERETSPKPAKKGKKDAQQATREESRVKDRFFEALLGQVLEKVDMAGVAGEIARLVGPKLGAAISVQDLANELAEKHGDALAKELSAALLTKLLE